MRLTHSCALQQAAGDVTSRGVEKSLDAARTSAYATSPILLTATLFGFFESVKEAPRVGACQRVQAVRLALLDGIAGHCPFRAQRFGFLLHLRVPHVFVILADVHEDAHFRNGLELGGAGL